MKQENPELYNLKLTTLHAVEMLMSNGLSQIDACKKFYSTVKRKHQLCGFKLASFEKFHNSFRQFKFSVSKNNKNSQTVKKYLIDNSNSYEIFPE